jgi:hypothetical protein
MAATPSAVLVVNRCDGGVVQLWKLLLLDLMAVRRRGVDVLVVETHPSTKKIDGVAVSHAKEYVVRNSLVMMMMMKEHSSDQL